MAGRVMISCICSPNEGRFHKYSDFNYYELYMDFTQIEYIFPLPTHTLFLLGNLFFSLLMPDAFYSKTFYLFFVCVVQFLVLLEIYRFNLGPKYPQVNVNSIENLNNLSLESEHEIFLP